MSDFEFSRILLPDKSQKIYETQIKIHRMEEEKHTQFFLGYEAMVIR